MGSICEADRYSTLRRHLEWDFYDQLDRIVIIGGLPCENQNSS
jgi:hypothetical protein